MFHNTAYQLSNTNNSTSERFFSWVFKSLKEKKRQDLTGVSGCSSNASWAHSPDQSLYSLILLRTVFWQVTQVPRWRTCSLDMKGEGEKWGGKKRKKNPSQNKLLPLKTSPDFQIRACTCVCMADAGLAWSVSQQVLKGLPRSHPSKAFQILRGADNCKYFLC